MAEVSVIDGAPYNLGEGAVWDDAAARLLTIDMVGGSMRSTSFGPSGVEHRDQRVGDFVGAVLPATAGDGVIVTMRGLASIVDGRAHDLVTVLDDASTRLNDAACDAKGRVWVGSTALDNSPGRGALYAWAGATPEIVADGLTLPNGVGWSPDGSTLYLADSGQSAVLRADFDVVAGTIGHLETLAIVQQGVPDGLCIGDDGSLWVAIWEGSRVERISPQGQLLETVALPVTRPTSCAFVPGVGLVITSARFGLDPESLAREPLAGRLFLHANEGAGVPSGRVAL